MIFINKAIKQVENFSLPTDQKLDIEFIFEQLEIRFHQKNCCREDCLKIIDIFRRCGRNEKASELKLSLKTGH